MADSELQFDETNAAVLAELLVDPITSEFVKLQILHQLLESDKSSTFFEAMFRDGMSLCECPHCYSLQHWLIPEDDLNMFGWVTHERDSRVKKHTTKEDCEEFQEACGKKKVTA